MADTEAALAKEEETDGAALLKPALLPPRRGGEPYLLPWGGRYYHVHYKNVVSFAKSANKISSAQELGRLLVSLDEVDWHPYLRPEYLMCLNGIEGKQVFTTFQLDNHPDEKRILRVVPRQICWRCFPELCKLYPSWENPSLNDRQRVRAEVILYQPANDLPSRDPGYVLSPISNAWPEVEWPAGSVAIWPGDNLLLKAADPIFPQVYDIGELDSDEDADGVSFSEPYMGTRPTGGRLEHVPFAPPPLHEARRMRAAHEHVKLAHEKMQCIRKDVQQYVSRILEQNVQAQRIGDIARPSDAPLEGVHSTKDAVRNATDEIFELKEQLSEGSYVEIAKSLKRSWDCAV